MDHRDWTRSRRWRLDIPQTKDQEEPSKENMTWSVLDDCQRWDFLSFFIQELTDKQQSSPL